MIDDWGTPPARPTDAERSAYAEERQAWIAEHGSRRLRLLQAEGLGLDETYRLERFAYEYPGWEWADDPHLYLLQVSNATEEALDELTAVRLSVPGTRLAWGPFVSGSEAGLGLVALFLGQPIKRPLASYEYQEEGRVDNE